MTRDGFRILPPFCQVRPPTLPLQPNATTVCVAVLPSGSAVHRLAFCGTLLPVAVTTTLPVHSLPALPAGRFYLPHTVAFTFGLNALSHPHTYQFAKPHWWPRGLHSSLTPRRTRGTFHHTVYRTPRGRVAGSGSFHLRLHLFPPRHTRLPTATSKQRRFVCANTVTSVVPASAAVPRLLFARCTVTLPYLCLSPRW